MLEQIMIILAHDMKWNDEPATATATHETEHINIYV